ncbi:MAG: hypothetical protein AB7P76_10585 [Candidatus Melainabacteria bacterium]
MFSPVTFGIKFYVSTGYNPNDGDHSEIAVDLLTGRYGETRQETITPMGNCGWQKHVDEVDLPGVESLSPGDQRVLRDEHIHFRRIASTRGRSARHPMHRVTEF